jgi:hypothetical protein
LISLSFWPLLLAVTGIPPVDGLWRTLCIAGRDRNRLDSSLHAVTLGLIVVQAYELVELSAVIAVNGQSFVRGRGRLGDNSISRYWSASRCRFDRWAHALKRYHGLAQADGKPPILAWRRVRPVLEETLTGEILTRVWTAVACEHDRRRGSSYVSPVVRSVFLGHLEARNRALNLIFNDEQNDINEVLAMNRLRCRCERWTDMLLGYLMPHCEIADLAIDSKRVRDFAEDIGDEHQGPNVEQAWQLLYASLQSTFRSRSARVSPNADLNSQIASSILACFPPEVFDSIGMLSSLWLERLNCTTADTQALIEKLLDV